ncbi:MAG: hypothetical protein ABF876_19645, partial [Acetobacter aceti]
MTGFMGKVTRKRYSGEFKSRVALVRYGTPEIFNTDQGSQFTTRKHPATAALLNISILVQL